MQKQQFVAFLQQQNYAVHSVVQVRDMLCAQFDGGSAYAKAGKVLFVEGEQDCGELCVERIVHDTTGELCNAMQAEYEMEDNKIVVHYDSMADEFEEWDAAAEHLLDWIA